MTDRPTAAIGYCRQSVGRAGDDRDGGSVSVEGQRQGIARLAKDRGWRLLGIHEDVDVSGATRTRAGLDAALDQIRQGGVHALIVNDLSRLARDTRLYLDIDRVLREHQVELVSVREGGQVPWVRTILVAIAEGQLERISRDITVAKRTAASRGRHAGYAPLGYLSSGPGELVVDHEHVPTIQRIYRELLEGRKPNQIAEGLNRDGVPTPGRVRRSRNPESKVGTDYWTQTTVQKMARCATYAGLSRVGAASATTLGRSLDVVEAPGTWEPIVDRQTWDAVQRLLGPRSLAVRTKGVWHPLGGRLTCAHCGRRLYFYGKRPGATHNGRAAAWRCSSKDQKERGHPDHVCPSPVKSGSDAWVSPLVIDALAATLDRRLTIEDARAAAEQERDRAMPVERRDAIEREVAGLVERRERIVHAIEHGIGDLAALADRDREIAERLASLAQEATALPDVPDVAALDQAARTLDSIRDTLDRLLPEQWAEILARLGVGARVDFGERRAHITLADPFRWLVAP